MEVFTQFSSDLDDATKMQLTYGSGLMELLKQPLAHPMSMCDQVLSLVLATNKIMVGVETHNIKKFQGEILKFYHQEHPEIVQEIETTRQLSDELREKIITTAKEYISR